MKNMDWKILASLGDSRTFSEVGDTLFTTQSNISKRVKSIEKELDVALFIRSKHGMTLTPKGAYLIERAKVIDREIETTLREIDKIGKPQFREVSVMAYRSFWDRYSAHLLLRFKELYPHVNLIFQTEKSDEIVRKIENNEVDIGFYHSTHHPSNSKSVLFDIQNLYLAGAEEITLDKLMSFPYVSYPMSAVSEEIIQNWWEDMFDAPARSVMQTGSLAACKQVVNSGLGYSFFYASSSEIDNLSGNIKIRPLNYKDGRRVYRETWVSYSERSASNMAARQFFDYLIDLVEEENLLY